MSALEFAFVKVLVIRFGGCQYDKLAHKGITNNIVWNVMYNRIKT